MIKLINLLKEALNKKYSFSQLQDFVKLWYFSKDNDTVSSEEKNAIQVLNDIGFLKKSDWFDGHIYTDYDPDYKTTDGKDFEDLSYFVQQLIKSKYPPVKYTDPEPVKKKKGKFSFDYGNFLFADLNLDVADSSKLKKFLKKWYTTNEPNTEDENEFLSDLKSYTSDNEPGNIEKVLKIVAPLKSKFPGILDPSKSKNKKTKLVYRGTYIPVDSISKYNAKITKGYAEYNNSVALNFKKKFMSFSVDLAVAHEFATEHGDWEEKTIRSLKKGMIPAIICIPITDPNLIFNPDFISIFSEYDDIEAETFYLNNSVSASKILIPNEIIRTIKDNVNKIPVKYKLDYKKVIKY